MKKAIAGALTAGLLVSSAAVAGAQTGQTGQTVGEHSMEGEVTRVDTTKGWVHVKTSEGTLIVHFPPSEIQNLPEGRHHQALSRADGQRSLAQEVTRGRRISVAA